MKPSISRRALLGGGLGVILVPASPAAASGTGPLRVGVLTELTGPLAAHGKAQLQGVRHRAAALNSATGHEQVIELIVQDTAGDPAKAAEAVSMLLDQGVHALIGSSLASTTGPAAKAAQASCTPMLAPAPAPGPDQPYVFPAGASPAQVAAAMARVVKKAGLTKVGLLSLDQLSTPEALQPLADQAQGQGLTLGPPVQFPADATELTPQLTELLTQSPEALLLNAPAPLDGIAVRDARAAGWTGPILVLPTAVNPGFHPTAGEAAEGVQTVAPWIAAPGQAPDTLPELATMRRFAESFAAVNGPAGPLAAAAADAVTLLHLAFLGHRDRKTAQAQLEHMCCLGICGVYNMTPDNHAGLSGDSLTTMTSLSGVWTPEAP